MSQFMNSEVSNKYKILFVCLGNICRSPASHGIMDDIVAKSDLHSLIEIDSAGTYGGHAGQLPDSRMRRAASNRGYILDHRARQICEDDYYDFDMIVVMDDMNYESVCRMAPERKYLDKVYRLTSFCSKHPDRTYVPDPYYEGREGFELVLDLLDDGCQGIFEYVKKQIKKDSK